MSDKLTLKGSKKIWYPARVNSLDSYLSVLIKENIYFNYSQVSSLKKNISYNLQYVEFLNRIIKDIDLSSVLFTQNIKIFVICSASIVEAIFHYIVVSNGKEAKTDWKSYKSKTNNNEFDVKGDKFKTVTDIYIKVSPPIPESMTFHSLCKKIEDNKMLGDVRGDLYKEISYIRKLRNKIHIQGIQNSTDTDWWTFDNSELNLMKRVLYGVLTSPVFSNSSQSSLFNYLK